LERIMPKYFFLDERIASAIFVASSANSTNGGMVPA